MNTLKRKSFIPVLLLCLLVTFCAQAQESDTELIAEAESAAPESVTKNATIKNSEGRVLRQGSNSWTCYPGSGAIGPMCNESQWDELIGAVMTQAPIDVQKFSLSYMMAGEGEALGVSNVDPFATEPTDDNQWVKEGPHLMILVPDQSALEGISTDPEDPVYVMWKGTPYAHIMVKVGEQE
jgi:hypothetical protein